MKRYIVGTETRMHVVEREPQVMRYTDGTPRASFPQAGGGGAYAFRIVRGRLQEFRSQGFPAGEHVYARELPDDALDELLEYDERVNIARAALAQAQLDRQAYLANTAVRGKLVKATPLPVAPFTSATEKNT